MTAPTPTQSALAAVEERLLRAVADRERSTAAGPGEPSTTGPGHAEA